MEPWEVYKKNKISVSQYKPFQPGDDMSWGEVAGEAITNIPSSGVQFGKDIAKVVTEPVEVGKALWKISSGLVQKMIPGEQANEATVDAVGKFLAERYGGIENIKRTIAKDPVGVLADVSTIFTGGGMAAARAPAMAGQIARGVQTAGQVIDPLNIALKTTGALAKAPKLMAATLGGTGTKALETAFGAGTTNSKTFLENLRSKDVDFNQVVSDAKNALQELRQNRNSSYLQTKGKLASEMKQVGLGGIRETLDKFSEAGKLEGTSVVSRPRQQKVVNDIRAIVDEWDTISGPDRKVAHSVIGLDELKIKIRDEVNANYPIGSPERTIAKSVVDGLTDSIKAADPDYHKWMTDYADASRHIDDLERTFSLGAGKINDNALRKLQSIMRQNVNTNFGARTQLAEKLTRTKAGENISEQLAGQSLNPMLPRGISRYTGPITAMGAGSVLSNPWVTGGLLPFMSPRLAGEVAYKTGQARGLMNKIPPQVSQVGRAGYGMRLPAFQAGRLSEVEQNRLRNAPKRNR